MYTKQINPIAIQSQNMITDAFFELLGQQSYDSITVTALCEKAKVGRKTFYRNFETMNDIIMYRVDHLVKDYVENQPNLNNRKQLLIYFFNTCKQNIDILIPLYKNNLLGYLETQINKISFHNVSLYGENVKSIKYISHFYTAGLVVTAIIWGIGGFEETVEEMAEIIVKAMP